MIRRRRLGQHYLVDDIVISKIITTAAVREDERLLEIGPGRGSLTFELSRCTRRMEAYELDRHNYLSLRGRLANRVNLHHGDAFKAEPEFDVLVSSLPYSASSTFVEWLSKRDYDRAVLVLQEEFVRKLLSPPGTKDYRAISAISQISSSVEIDDVVRRSSFAPPPKVNSRIAVIRPRRRLDDASLMMIKKLFSLRRRRLGTVAKGFGIKADANWAQERVQCIPPDEVYRIAVRSLGR